MNKRGSTTLTILVILAVVLIGVLGCIYLSKISSTPPTSNSEDSSNGNLVSRSDWGISFVKTSDWNVTASSGTQMELTQVNGENKGDRMTIQFISSGSGSQITDSDAKFGDVTYRYEQTNGKWMVTGITDMNAMDGPTSTRQAVPQFMLHGIDGRQLPVFQGRSRWLTYIVPLNPFLFLKFNITGSGATQPLTDLVKSMKETKSNCYECGAEISPGK